MIIYFGSNALKRELNLGLNQSPLSQNLLYLFIAIYLFIQLYVELLMYFLKYNNNL